MAKNYTNTLPPSLARKHSNISPLSREKKVYKTVDEIIHSKNYIYIIELARDLVISHDKQDVDNIENNIKELRLVMSK